MKILNTMKIALITLLPFFMLQSCGSSTSERIEDEQLSSFMLGGIYFFNGYGDTNDVANMMIGAGYTTDQELVGGYKEILEFPFDSSQASGIKSVFKSMWSINNKEQLVESINDLKTREHPYKAWDYARIVNNANMGYACGFLTKEEVIKTTLEILPLAREKFKNWDDYFADFNKGRIDWNPEDKDSKSFENLVNTITKYDRSIYKILPLNADKE
ncbi:MULTISPECIES: DUF1266 domain-containing protein [Flavobacterium]|uniref:DUF1266 domain-containing protein n=1 Tax=Flavobacterium jumunjinense TaxID=998845 RepID=A0ABV5GKI7_9FLAO|nr:MULTISPECIES: DUF1266 domain-containing protein [Flavobacterium]